MTGFLTPLRFEKIGAHRWLLIDDLVYESMMLQGQLIVPRGFQTDLASIPRWLWMFAPPVDIYDSAAVLHDGGYGNALITNKGERIFLIKFWCDRLFAEACISVGVSGWRTQLMFKAVERFGDPKGHPLAAHYDRTN